MALILQRIYSSLSRCFNDENVKKQAIFDKKHAKANKNNTIQNPELKKKRFVYSEN